MDLTQLANLGEFIGGVAVLVTLIYLVIQVRQGNANARAASRQTLIDTYSQSNFDLGHDAELLRILGDGFSDYPRLSNSDKIQFDFIMSRYVANVYNGVLLHRDGVLDYATLDQVGGLLTGAASTPGGSVWWWPHPQEVRDYVTDYRQRHPGPLPHYTELFPYWVSAPGTESS